LACDATGCFEKLIERPTTIGGNTKIHGLASFDTRDSGDGFVGIMWLSGDSGEIYSIDFASETYTLEKTVSITSE
jgi:hypothetical protein